MKKNNMAILLIGFDGYDDLWKDFFALFRHYWKDCPYQLYLANNSLDYQVEGVKQIHAGDDAEWSRKVQNALEVIEEDYICLMLEDFYLGKKVDSQVIEETIKLMEKDNLLYYKLKSFSPIRTKNYKAYKYLHVIPSNLEYGISLQPGIWRKEFLNEKVGTENYNAWKFECDRIAEEKNKSKEPIIGCVYDERNILQIQHGVVQGKYLPKTVKYFEKRGYHLNQERRTAMRGRQYFVYRCKAMNLPKFIRKILKRIMHMFGYKFVTDLNA